MPPGPHNFLLVGAYSCDTVTLHYLCSVEICKWMGGTYLQEGVFLQSSFFISFYFPLYYLFNFSSFLSSILYVLVSFVVLHITPHISCFLVFYLSLLSSIISLCFLLKSKEHFVNIWRFVKDIKAYKGNSLRSQSRCWQFLIVASVVIVASTSARGIHGWCNKWHCAISMVWRAVQTSATC